MKNFKKRYIFYAVAVITIMLIKGAIYSDVSLEELKKEYTNEASKFIEIDGMQVHYRDEGQGFPIVLVHGTASSLHTWNDWTKDLKKKYRVIRMDLPAFGITGPNKNADYSIENYTYFLQQFLMKINVAKFHLAGNSLGGNIAWNYAAEHPEQIEKLILIDASGLPTNKPQPAVFKMAKTPVLSSLFLYVTPKFFIKKNMEEVYADNSKVTDAIITRYHKMALRVGNRQAFIDRAKTDFKLGAKANLEKLKSIQTPSLLIWGAQDSWIPLDNGKQMDRMLTNSKLVILENSGHVPMEENPAESLEALNGFLED
ncbi:MAG: alpha/beta hydrolase [Polaribacter sp.]|jgi:pimeloyl-ACP methyl ester carboxylesterase|uniref:alpha/beta fold hydrolase n=1 Tax=Polaribacter sp. TaxID=1920175 RepID=UPI00260FA6DD|nr:alpha/beta hydrolase [Polaribacter sp.]MBT3741390.1 alpha/beta hydrolase [Polaribacter sp.]MBT4414589.1 alpha/beta hydrolase [Polaribacter sp.]MDG1196212.1 alpha/beta hydrolase [Polaribacter sp.]MDG1402672.1 alpha/beta hydrolase [Polaribacter sp.]MDG2436724.1 alpha/beta hydrolase [Polaribacter sp.]